MPAGRLALLSGTFPYLVRGTPPGLGPEHASGIVCKATRDSGGYFQPLKYPQGAELRETDRWSGTTAVRPVYFMTRTPLSWPTVGVANLLFNAPDATVSAGLGLASTRSEG